MIGLYGAQDILLLAYRKLQQMEKIGFGNGDCERIKHFFSPFCPLLIPFSHSNYFL